MIPVPCKKCLRRDAAPCDDKGTCFTCRGLKFEYGEMVLHVHGTKFRIVGTLGGTLGRKAWVVENPAHKWLGEMMASEVNLRKMPKPKIKYVKISSEAC